MKKDRLLTGYLLGRLALLTVLMPLAAYFMVQLGNVDHVSFRLFFLMTGAAFIFSLATAVVVRTGRKPRLLIAAQPAWDIVYTTLLTYFSGGWFSPFVFLYLLGIIGAAILLTRKGALGAATLSAFFYSLLAILQMENLVVPLNPFLVDLPTGPTFISRLAFHIIAFYAVALLAGYLTEELKRTGESLTLAKREILDLEHLQAAILRSMGSGLMAVDLEGKVMFLNQAGEALLRKAGMSPEEHAGLFSDQRADRLEATIGRMVIGYSVVQLLSRNGLRLGRIISFQDLTEIRKLAEELARADRMAAVGRLAAGLAHEIRNPLASLSGSAQMLESSFEVKTDEQSLLFSLILKETERLNNLVIDFLGYARPGELRATSFPLRDFVEELGYFIRQGEGREKFELANEIPSELTVEADRDKLQSLFLNLFRNSIEAGGEAVRVAVEARVCPDRIEITVADNGPGFSPEYAARAFEPFVSGKEGGTGLGLATVHRIVVEHGGSIELENRPGEGAVFRLRLPLRNAA